MNLSYKLAMKQNIVIFHTDNWYYLAMPGNFDHNIDQSGVCCQTCRYEC
jgi:hypothetical protein